MKNQKFVTVAYLWVAVCAIGLLGMPATPHARAESTPVLVFAAASMKTALDSVNTDFEVATGQKVVTSYAASSALARQVAAGAPADIFISADEDWMNDLARQKLIVPDTRTDLLTNRLVLIAPKNSPLQLTLEVDQNPGPALVKALEGGRLAIPETSSVPAGKYGKAALTALKAWGDVENRLAPADNVRAALALVSRGEAPLGIVYQTDAVSDPAVRVVALFPETTHPKIVYPVARLVGAPSPSAQAYLDFLKGPKARARFVEQGFQPIKSPVSGS